MDPNQQPPQQNTQYQPVQNQYGQMPPMTPQGRDHHQRNIIVIGVLSMLSVLLLAGSVWLYSLYMDQKNNVDQIAQQRVDAALEQQAKKLDEEFTKQQENNRTRYQGPSIYGSINFAYPKLWSVYDNPDTGSSLLFEVKVHPNAVGRGVSGEAIITRVIDENYDEVLSEYEKDIEEGVVTAKAIKSNGQVGVRLSGAVGEEEGQSGVTILLPLRDRTIELSNLSLQHSDVFDATIKSLKFQP